MGAANLAGPMYEVLTPEQMYRADALAAAAGTPSLTLMENAGRAVAEAIVRRFGARPTLVLCGPGNNGGDGYVVARYLKRWGWPVRLHASDDPSRMKGDAAHMASLWDGTVERTLGLGGASLIVDALFGAGLSKDFPAELAAAINGANVPVVAVDVPSGLDGLTGRPRGASIKANLTVTFFRKKPGHLLLPGRDLCGEVVVAGIGIVDSVLEEIAPKLLENHPPLLPQPAAAGHKYSRGHAVVVSGGPLHTGASRLSALSAMKTGAGLVTLSGSADALAVHAAHVTAVMLSDLPLAELLADRRKNAVCIGPAAGVGAATRAKVEAVLESGAATVLDADALTSVENCSADLFRLIALHPGRPVVMTPHTGELSRLFKDMTEDADSKLELARKASAAR